MCNITIFVVSECKHQLVRNLYMTMRRVIKNVEEKADLGILSNPKTFLFRSSGESISRKAQSNNMESRMVG